ncbi:ribonuclease III [uncultured Enterovirga sp.]|uniref:ribonuclease III n=1 Tax=uncultured Enterovirga sp. TaxID=2026352 RepID=UPI0035C9DFA8
MARRHADPASLEAKLGYRFADAALATEALTHVSSASGGPTYQRLEFLGDRVLGLAIADLLMKSFPGASEGDLSRRLAELVRRETCAAVATAWDIGPHLRLGSGASGTMRRNGSILADACEAVIGAVFIDGGWEAARDLVARGFGGRLADQAELPSNPKTQLQEWAAALGLPPPTYAILDRTGPDHSPHFRVAVRVDGLADAIGTGGSRRAAEQSAAQAALLREGVAAAVETQTSNVAAACV